MKWITCDRCGNTADGEIGRHMIVSAIGGDSRMPRMEYCLDCGEDFLAVLEDFTEQRSGRETPKRKREREDSERRERHDAWRATAGEQRQRLILEALTFDRLSVGQIAARLTERHRDEFGGIYVSMLRNEIGKMLDAGELDRVRDDFRNKPRCLYFRKDGLSGPIAGLEALLDHESEDQ